MEEEKPCCAAAAARKIRKVMISGQEIGVAQLDEIIARVSAIGLEDEIAIERALMKEVKIYNYVPVSREKEYSSAIMLEYVRRSSHGKEN